MLKLDCVCSPPSSVPFTCRKTGRTMTPRDHELCSGVNCTVHQRLSYAKWFHQQKHEPTPGLPVADPVPPKKRGPLGRLLEILDELARWPKKRPPRIA